jgi:hypothetical protein
LYDKTGMLVQAGVHMPRFSYDPFDLTKPPILLLEPNPATNSVRNNTMQGAAVGTPGTMPSNWELFIPSGCSRSIVDIGTENGIEYIDIRIYGTCNANSQGIAIYPAIWGQALASLGQVWVHSSYVKLVGGSLTGLQGVVIGIDERDSTGIWLGADSVPITTTAGTLRTKRFQHTRTVSLTGAYCLTPHIYTNVPNGASIDVTLRIGLPQLERDRVSSPIKTTGAAVTRAADVATIGLISTLSEAGEPAPYVADKVYALGDRMMTPDHKLYESGMGVRLTGVSVQSGGYEFTKANHGLTVSTPVVFETGGFGYALNTQYYVMNTGLTSNTFRLSTAVNGGDNPFAVVTTSNITLVAGGNFNRPAPNEDFWIDVGSTNKWAMLDQSIESQTSNADLVAAGLRTPSNTLVDTVVIQNIAGAQAVRVALIDPIEGIVYDKTVSLSSTDGINDPYAYAFEPITRDTDVLFTGLPPYAGAYISVTIAGTGETVKCGLCLMGLSKNFGPTQAGMSLGLQDYSIKEKNDYGNTKVQERAYSKTMSLTCFVDRSKMNSLLNLLNSARATPMVYIGDETLTSSVQYGFYNDYNMGADYPEHSVLHIEIESLT